VVTKKGETRQKVKGFVSTDGRLSCERRRPVLYLTMAEELLVNVTPHETRIAVVESGVLQAIIIERHQKKGHVGNIFLGRVARVLPGMQAAFVHIGLERAAFLHVADLINVPGAASTAPDDDGQPAPGIDRLLTEGQEIVVQVTKDPLIGKGARLTTRLSIPSRYVVLLAGQAVLGISQKISDEGERERLRTFMLARQPALRTALEPGAAGPVVPAPDPPDGFILRTAAQGVPDERLADDVGFVQHLWASIRERLARAQAPLVVYEDLPLVLRTLRSVVADEVERIRIDDREAFEQVAAFASEFLPDVCDRIEHYRGEPPILDLYSVEAEIQKALERRVDLKSGGHLVIDQTEAMTTVDVNTGAFVGHRNLEETILKTNLEAAQAIARQLRLRNLGGIIIADFIDMTDPEHQRQVLKALEKGLERDDARVSVSDITSLGLVQITRQRTRESLEHVLCEPCPTCAGRGSVKSAETVCYEISREVLRSCRQFDAKQILVLAPPAVAERFLDDASAGIAEMQVAAGRPITVRAEVSYGPEQYDVVPL
jgi:ribonuclease G